MKRLLFRLNQWLHRIGFQLSAVESPTSIHLRRLLFIYPIETIIDVGANCGQYGTELRSAGYTGKIISCEPLGAPFETLRSRALLDPQWQCLNIALSDQDRSLDLHVSQATEYSSALPILPGTVARDGTACVTRTETVHARTLDSLWEELETGVGPIMLKIDTQGSEEAILNGAKASLEKLAAIQLELSAEPIYAGQPVMEQMIARVRAAGFVPYQIWSGFRDEPTGRVLEYDGIFVRAAGLTSSTLTH